MPVLSRLPAANFRSTLSKRSLPKLARQSFRLSTSTTRLQHCPGHPNMGRVDTTARLSELRSLMKERNIDVYSQYHPTPLLPHGIV